MKNIPLSDIFAQMPVEELKGTLNDFVAPVTNLLSEECLRKVVKQAVCGILGGETTVSIHAA